MEVQQEHLSLTRNLLSMLYCLRVTENEGFARLSDGGTQAIFSLFLVLQWPFAEKGSAHVCDSLSSLMNEASSSALKRKLFP